MMKNLADTMVCYTCTNERLEAIVLGLRLTPEDRVLSAGGSGDQAFAILEYVKSVDAVDILFPQARYITQRKGILERGLLDWFLQLDPFAEGKCPFTMYDKVYRSQDLIGRYKGRRDSYFMQEGRFGRISAKAGDVRVEPPSDIFEVAAREGGFNKIYLSNTLRYDRLADLAGVRALLHNTAANLPASGLIYITNLDRLLFDYASDSLFSGIYDLGKEEYIGRCREYCQREEGAAPFLPDELRIDEVLTGLALENETAWRPGVLRKIH
jgi:hypothetical protein